MKTIDEHLSDISFADTESQCGYPCRSPDLVKERDREVAAAARREGWEAGVREGWDGRARFEDGNWGLNTEALKALIARGPK